MRLMMAIVLLTALTAGAGEAVPTVPVDQAGLRMQELTLQREQLSKEMFKVLAKIRLQREEALKQDEELKALIDEISRLQAELEKRLVEKYPELAGLVGQREELQAEYDQIRQEQVTLHEKQQKDLKTEDPSGKE